MQATNKVLDKIDKVIEDISGVLVSSNNTTMTDLDRYVKAAKEYVEWEEYEPFKIEISNLLKDPKSNENELKKRFGKRISFGTAGLRSRMGGGYAFMNDLVILQTCQVCLTIIVQCFVF